MNIGDFGDFGDFDKFGNFGDVLPISSNYFIHWYLYYAGEHWRSASQILADFGAHLSQFKHASNRLVYFRLSPTYFPVRPLNDMTI